MDNFYERVGSNIDISCIYTNYDISFVSFLEILFALFIIIVVNFFYNL